jgi:phosphatidylglycerol---prolipoprotein diacylglyceryl transferase
LILQVATDATATLNFNDLGLSKVALDLGFFQIRWYSLSYIAAILTSWWLLLKLIAQPGAPMARRHVDDFIFYATIGIIAGGRLGYIVFYKPSILQTPVDIFKLWEGGMSFHGGLIGVVVGLIWFCWRNKLNGLRVADYVAVVAPLGPLFVRPANFVNGELWGRESHLPWAMIFPDTHDGIPRHPSQLYEMGLEGALLLAVMALLFWRSDARYYPGRLVGVAAIGYGLVRTLLELVREPDAGLEQLSWGLTMGQTLSIPMILIGLFLLLTSGKRRVRVEPVAGSAAFS